MYLMQKVIMKTYGCSNNIAESEMMMGLLTKEGYIVEESENYNKGDAVIFNMCSVKGPSVTQCLTQIKKIKTNYPNKKIIVAGCVPLQLIPDIKNISEDISIVNTSHVDKIKQALEQTLDHNPVEYKKFARPIKLGFPRVRKNPIVSIIPILQGCNDFCTYCSTKLVKGNTFSYPESMIVREAMKSVKEGCKEIWLTSQDNGAYQTDNGYVGLPELIKKIAMINGMFYIRVGMANPTYLLQCLQPIIEILKHDKVYTFLHIPFQSGNNEILKGMKRRYTALQYKEIVEKLKKELPDITIASDVIVGFPGETDEQFQDTYDLIKETKPDKLHISRFQARPGTKAAHMKQVPDKIIKERSRKITTLFKEISLDLNKKWINKECYILIDEHGQKGNDSIGRNISYKQVVVKEKIELGSIVKVKIKEARIFDLVGELI